MPMRSAFLATFLLISGTFQAEVPRDLTTRVTQYWDSLVKRDKVSALGLVVPEAGNDFILRKEPPFKSWSLESIELTSESSALVTVKIERITPEGQTLGFSPVSENWILRDGQWLVSVVISSQKEVLQAIAAARRESRPLSGELKIVPSRLRINFLSRLPQGVVRLRNERPDMLRVESIELDRERFKILTAPGSLESGEQGELRIEYLGEEIKKNLEANLVIHLEYQNRQEEISIPLIYNYFSDTSRRFFGLTKEEVDELPRGVTPRPAIPPPIPNPRKPPL